MQGNTSIQSLNQRPQLERSTENLQGLIASLIQKADQHQAVVLNRRKRSIGHVNNEINNPSKVSLMVDGSNQMKHPHDSQINQHHHNQHHNYLASMELTGEHMHNKIPSNHPMQMAMSDQVRDLLSDPIPTMSQIPMQAIPSMHQVESGDLNLNMQSYVPPGMNLTHVQLQQQDMHHQHQHHHGMQSQQLQQMQQQLQQQSMQPQPTQMQQLPPMQQQPIPPPQMQQQVTPPAPQAEGAPIPQTGSKSNREIVNRRRYSDSEKETIIGIYHQYDVKEAALTIIRSIPTFEKVDRNMIKRWIKRPEKGGIPKLGRPVCNEFERDVLQMCIKEAQNSGARMDDSSIFSYSTVRRCAIATVNAYYPDEHGNMVQKWQMFRTEKKLKFSNKWVNGFMKRLREMQEYHNIAAAASAAASAAAGSAGPTDALMFGPDGCMGATQADVSTALLQQMAMYNQDDEDDDDDDDDLRLPEE